MFADVLLADEINRATPRSQSALLEAMAERQVTVDAQRYSLSDQFFVIATQNPVDQHGTYPLPEAQLDRFAMKLSVGYPERADEMQMLQDAILQASQGRASADNSPVLEPRQLAAIQKAVASLPVASIVQDYLVRLGHESRRHASVVLGLSPRGLLTWQRTAQARAWLQGRDFVTPDDVQDVAGPVLGVRLGLDQTESAAVVQDLLSRVPVPDFRDIS